ncbi:hypothetical protein B9Z55_013193 [Caenorhabditis nigoni]|uniref:Uncharacterized protein n=1 Tax=Caenorhabditis nigoni TaxID=1611254 RepID=A0A2G5U0J1_9PELO|nr:hypothetical protein B9Z55_013193 [Caenorhabditis nigoni]
MEDELLVEQNYNNRYVMETDMDKPESFGGACREPAFLRNGLFDNGYGEKIYPGDEMEVDHVEEIETDIEKMEDEPLVDKNYYNRYAMEEDMDEPDSFEDAHEPSFFVISRICYVETE